MVAETYSFFGNFPQTCQTPYLEASTVRQHRAIPARKSMQPAQVAYGLIARSEAEVIGVAQDNLSPQCFQVFRMQGLDGSLGAHRHENGSGDIAVRQVQGAEACAGGVRFMKGKTHELRTNLAAKMGLPMASHCCWKSVLG